MDNKLTKQIRSWLDTPKGSRDIQAGALMLLQLSSNRIQYNNIIMNPQRNADVLEYQLQKYYDFRVQSLTKSEVSEMSAKVEKIVEMYHLDKEETSQTSNLATQTSPYRRGKRADHDSLPDEIQALYVENLSLMHKMRELHLKLRQLSTENVTCPDSERYPFLKEFINVDRRYRSNWEQYDHYVVSQGKVVITQSAREENLKALRIVNLYKGRYKKNPSEEIKKVILENYAKIVSPSEKLARELSELNII